MKRPEQLLQQAVFNSLRPLMFFQKYSDFMAFQVKNEGSTGGRKAEIIAGIDKSMGKMAGVSDTIFLFKGNRQCFVEYKAFKELKTKIKPIDDYLSEEQKTFRDRVTKMGFDYRVIVA